MRLTRVVVAGAGLAGLTVACELAKSRVSVTIVEARDRVGGRVWTVRDSFVNGAYGELGPEFIDEDHDRVRVLATRFGIELVRVLQRGFTQRYRGDDGKFVISRRTGWDELRQALAPLVGEYDRGGGSPYSEGSREISTFSVRDWLHRVEAPPRVHAMADAMRGFFLADPEELSALPLAVELSQVEPPSATPVYRMAGGNDRLIDAMVQATPARWLLSHRLQAIQHAPDQVRCGVVDDRGRLQELEADAVVITLPASTLRDVEITPRLPETQWRAVCALRYGCATKAVLQTSGDLFGGRPARAFATDTHAGAFWDAGEGQLPGTSILSFLAGGSASAELSRRLEQGADALLSDLCWLRRGGSTPQAVKHAAWSWERDAFARGGYAYLDPGFEPRWLPLLGRRAGRVFFAGEHTSEDHQGYMEGAVESGERVVAEMRG